MISGNIFTFKNNLPFTLNFAKAVPIAESWLLNHAYKDIRSYPHTFTITKMNVGEVASYIEKQAVLQANTRACELTLYLMQIPFHKKLLYRNTVAEHGFGKIGFNPKFVYKRTVPDIVNTLVHEWLHSIGFEHDGNKPTDINLHSVPYTVGAMAEAYCRAQNL